MVSSEQLRNLILGRSLGAAVATLAIAFLLTFTTQPAQAQTFQVIHDFDQSGYAPYAGLTYRAGNLYGTAYKGGYMGGTCEPIQGCGTVYRLKQAGSGWIFNVLFTFNFQDGLNPVARVVFGPNGTLYGTTGAGGTGVCGSSGCGVVYDLSPPPSPCKSHTLPLERNRALFVHWTS